MGHLALFNIVSLANLDQGMGQKTCASFQKCKSAGIFLSVPTCNLSRPLCTERQGLVGGEVAIISTVFGLKSGRGGTPTPEKKRILVLKHPKNSSRICTLSYLFRISPPSLLLVLSPESNFRCGIEAPLRGGASDPILHT